MRRISVYFMALAGFCSMIPRVATGEEAELASSVATGATANVDPVAWASSHGILGRYAHYDVVAYEQDMPLGHARSLVISYGFTDYSAKDGRLLSTESFCHSEYKSNLPMTSTVPDAFTRAIVPAVTPVEVRNQGGAFHILRPETPNPRWNPFDRPVGDASR